MKASSRRVALIGAGRLARAFLVRLDSAGYRVRAVAATRLASARAAARLAPGARATTSLSEAIRDVDLVLLAVPDREIESVVRELSRLPGVEWAERVVLHHAGALGREVLDALHRRGAGTGVLHPMQCLGSPRLAARLLSGSTARIEGDGRALRAARRLARSLGLLPVELRGPRERERRADYHAAASIVANDLIALLDLGRELLARAGLEDKRARQALAALARGALAHYAETGEASALTGPVSRGDTATLLSHLERLGTIEGGEEVHRLLSRRLAAMVRRHGSAGAARAVERALSSGRQRSRRL